MELRRAMGALSVIAMLGVGCSAQNYEPFIDPPIPPPPKLVLDRPTYVQGVEAFTRQLALVRAAGPIVDEAGLIDAVEQLVMALERVPDQGDVPLDLTAQIMRDALDRDYEMSANDALTFSVRRALLTAAAALRLLAAGPYRDVPGLAGQVARFGRAAARLDARAALVSQRAQLVAALGEAQQALQVIATSRTGLAPARRPRA